MKPEKRRLPEGWKWVDLSELLTYVKEFFTIYDDEDYRLVTVKLYGKGIVEREVLKGRLIKMKQQQRIHENQFLVAEIDAKLGAFSIVPKEFDGAIVSGHYFLYNIDTLRVRPEFLQCYVASGLLTEKVQQYIQGALNYAAIRPHHILKVRIPFPLPESSTALQDRVINSFLTIRNMQGYAEHQLEAIMALEKQLMREAFDFGE